MDRYFLVGFRLPGTQCLCEEQGSIYWYCPTILMDPEGFFNALGDFLSSIADNSVEAWTYPWNGEMR